MENKRNYLDGSGLNQSIPKGSRNLRDILNNIDGPVTKNPVNIFTGGDIEVYDGTDECHETIQYDSPEPPLYPYVPCPPPPCPPYPPGNTSTFDKIINGEYKIIYFTGLRGSQGCDEVTGATGFANPTGSNTPPFGAIGTV